MFKLVVPRESLIGEKRVAATPETVRKFSERGLSVSVESKAGEAAFFSDQEYSAAGACIVSKPELFQDANLILTVRGLEPAALKSVPAGATLIGLLGGKGAVQVLTGQSIRAFSLELLPRTSRAQAMDILSSQSTIAGYWAVCEASVCFPRLFPLLMTAAGTLAPARVLVLGAGVAGLQAIATARRLGAIVSALDVRAAAREQVESLGAQFLDVPADDLGEGQGGYAQEMGDSYQKRQATVLKTVLPKTDVIIGTALIPGKPAPRMIDASMVELLQPGSVIIDLAADAGGNCELTQPCTKQVTSNGVAIIGEGNAPSRYPQDASALYARNLMRFVDLLWDAEKKQIKDVHSDSLLEETCVQNI